MKFLRITSIVVSAFVAFSAIRGGIALISTGGLGMSTELLNGVLPSYTIPGIILVTIVGGTHLLSAVALIRKRDYSSILLFISGCGLAIWLFTQLYIMKTPHFLQIINFTFAIFEISAAYLMANKLKTK